jgi:hypothetical protein
LAPYKILSILANYPSGLAVSSIKSHFKKQDSADFSTEYRSIPVACNPGATSALGWSMHGHTPLLDPPSNDHVKPQEQQGHACFTDRPGIGKLPISA